LRCEHENPQPIITDTIADKLRDSVHHTTLNTINDHTLDQIKRLMKTVATFKNERSQEILGSIANNNRYDDTIRKAAINALKRMA
jgi:hypothetical protein